MHRHKARHKARHNGDGASSTHHERRRFSTKVNHLAENHCYSAAPIFTTSSRRIMTTTPTTCLFTATDSICTSPHTTTYAPMTYTRKTAATSTTGGYQPAERSDFKKQSLNISRSKAPFVDVIPGYFTADAPMPSGKHKGVLFSQLPPQYLHWLCNSGAPYYREDLLKTLSQMGFTPYHAPFDYQHMQAMQIDSAIHLKNDQLLEPHLVPKHFGVGKTLQFENVVTSIAKATHIKEISDKLYQIKQLLWDANDIALPQQIERDLVTLEDIMEVTKIGNLNLKRIPQWSEVETALQKKLIIDGNFDVDDAFMDDVRPNNEGSIELDPETGTKRVVKTASKTSIKAAEFVKKPPGAAASSPEWSTLQSRITDRWKALLNPYVALLYENIKVGIPLLQNQQEDVAPWADDALVEEKTIYRATSDARLTPNSLVYVPRPLVSPIYRHSSGITFQLTPEQNQALEPYREVPSKLPSSFIFFDSTHVHTTAVSDIDPVTQLSTQLAALDGVGNEFNVHIQPDMAFEDLPHNSTDRFVANNYNRYWTPQSVSQEVGLDSFFQWIFHPTMGRKPLQRLNNPDFYDPLLKMKLFAKLRPEVDNKTASYDEIMELPEPVKRLFLDKTQKRAKVSYNYLTGTLTANGVQAQITSREGISKDFMQHEDGFIYVTKKRSYQLTENEFADAQVVNEISASPSSLASSSDSLENAESPKTEKQRQLYKAAIDANLPRYDPIFLVGNSLQRQIRRLDAELRSIDYKHHGNNIGGMDPSILERATIKSRGHFLAQNHRDTKLDSYRHSLVDSGIMYVDVNYMMPLLFQGGLERSGYNLRASHAALCGNDRSLITVDAFLNAAMVKDLFFMDNTAGAFFRAELDRIYTNTHNKSLFTLKDGLIYPESVFISDGSDLSFKLAPKTTPKRYSLFAGQYVDDTNSLSRSAATNLHQYYIYNTPLTRSMMVKNTDEQMALNLAHQHTPHSVPGVKSSSLLGGETNGILGDDTSKALTSTRCYGQPISSTDPLKLKPTRSHNSALPGTVGSAWANNRPIQPPAVKPSPFLLKQAEASSPFTPRSQVTPVPSVSAKEQHSKIPDPNINGDIPVPDF